jgi:hypothetical protein
MRVINQNYIHDGIKFGEYSLPLSSNVSSQLLPKNLTIILLAVLDGCEISSHPKGRSVIETV